MGGRIKSMVASAAFRTWAPCLGLSLISVLCLASVAQYGQLGLQGLFGSWRPVFTQLFAVVVALRAGCCCPG
ncbi:MAG: hypothetical protein AB7V55_07300 [Oscillospiraceae bacterium]